MKLRELIKRVTGITSETGEEIALFKKPTTVATEAVQATTGESKEEGNYPTFKAALDLDISKFDDDTFTAVFGFLSHIEVTQPQAIPEMPTLKRQLSLHWHARHKTIQTTDESLKGIKDKIKGNYENEFFYESLRDFFTKFPDEELTVYYDENANDLECTTRDPKNQEALTAYLQEKFPGIKKDIDTYEIPAKFYSTLLRKDHWRRDAISKLEPMSEEAAKRTPPAALQAQEARRKKESQIRCDYDLPSEIQKEVATLVYKTLHPASTKSSTDEKTPQANVSEVQYFETTRALWAQPSQRTLGATSLKELGIELKAGQTEAAAIKAYTPHRVIINRTEYEPLVAQVREKQLSGSADDFTPRYATFIRPDALNAELSKKKENANRVVYNARVFDIGGGQKLVKLHADAFMQNRTDKDKHTIFLVDTSGSMGGSRIEDARKSLQTLCERMGQDESTSAFITLANFSNGKDTGIRKFTGGSRKDQEIKHVPLLTPKEKVDQEMVDQLKTEIGQLEPTSGTMLLKGLETVLPHIKAGEYVNLIVVTDGEPNSDAGCSNEDDYLREVPQMVQNRLAELDDEMRKRGLEGDAKGLLQVTVFLVGNEALAAQGIAKSLVHTGNDSGQVQPVKNAKMIVELVDSLNKGSLVAPFPIKVSRGGGNDMEEVMDCGRPNDLYFILDDKQLRRFKEISFDGQSTSVLFSNFPIEEPSEEVMRHFVEQQTIFALVQRGVKMEAESIQENAKIIRELVERMESLTGDAMDGETGIRAKDAKYAVSLLRKFLPNADGTFSYAYLETIQIFQQNQSSDRGLSPYQCMLPPRLSQAGIHCAPPPAAVRTKAEPRGLGGAFFAFFKLGAKSVHPVSSAAPTVAPTATATKTTSSTPDTSGSKGVQQTKS